MKKILNAFTVLAALTFGSAVHADDISAYLQGELIDASEVSEKLSEAGFDVIGSYVVNKKNNLKTVIFTNDTLKEMAMGEGRGFAAIGRVLIDNKNEQISVSNPVYFGKAFLGDDADEDTLSEMKDALVNSFGELSDSDDLLDSDDIGDYHFMMGMPYYDDFAVIGEGSDDDLLEKASSNKNHLFTLDIGEGKKLVGLKLGKRTAKFPKKIGFQNAGVLPYTVLITNGEARMLAPKYYLAISYPLLTMSQFMKIATVPGAIEKDLTKVFK